MKIFYLLIALFSALLMTTDALWATHNRAGEIKIEQLEDCGLTIRATIITYTKESMVAADEDTLFIDWGDGFTSKAGRVNGPNNKGESLGNDVKVNHYVAYHTYSGRTTYTISSTEHNRTENIKNIPNSVFTPMHITTTYTFLNPQFQGCNSTPSILQPPIDFACVGKKFIHNPNAFDPDGDSLAYYLTEPLFANNSQVPGYSFPQFISPGPENSMTLDPVTGDLIWDAPQETGDYNVAIYIIEYRDGVAIDTTLRDMQILVESCDNNPPELTTIDEICVVAGDYIEFTVVATDPDNPLQKVQLSAIGGPLETAISAATFTVPQGYVDHPVEGTFSWQTTCEHISDQHYSIIFNAEDDDSPVRLNALKTVRIKVVGPPPLDVQAEPLDEQIKVTWESPYACEDAAENYFRTFSVWRRIGSNQFVIDTCYPGLAGQGYVKIDPQAEDIVDGRYSFVDSDVERGKTYCYRVLAEFAKTSLGGFPYNLVESLPSNETCVQLGRDVPLITKVSVANTDQTNGVIDVEWLKPDPNDLDTLQNFGPYSYEVFRQVGTTSDITDPIPGSKVTFSDFASANDTVFVDQTINTRDNPYSYKIAFYVKGESEPLGFSEPASSIYLTVSPSDKKNLLSWSEMVPWDNTAYEIYRKNLMTGIFDSIGSSFDRTFTDDSLVNGTEYCYYVRSIGSYGISTIVSPLINYSQEDCAIPEDNVAPCTPDFSVENVCSNTNLVDGEGSFYNYLVWSDSRVHCEDSDDLVGFNIYFAPNEGGNMTIIETLLDTTYRHYPDDGIAGCYAITAFDSVGNESPIDTILCVDNCPVYELPNAFTPNGDGQNEIFRPYPYLFVDRIDLKIFNQWGNLVFETTDPDINWEGRSMGGTSLPSGTYYYTCQVYENRVSGVVASNKLLSGYIELIGN